MSAPALSSSRLTLHALCPGDALSTSKLPPAILFRLSEELLEDVKKASTTPTAVQLVTGTTPKIRLGKRTIDLTISPEAFQHELFSAATDSLADLTLAAVVGHRAELKVPERQQSVGSDAALAALQNSLASYHQEKAAKSVTVTHSLFGTAKSRFEANRDQKHSHRSTLSASQHASPSLSGAVPISAPTPDPALRLKAMRKPLVHLLAIDPLSPDDIVRKTRIPKRDLDEILSKIGKADGKKMGLSDRAYRELDVWNFAYSTQEERQAAIDNAVRAYDRQRIGKEEKIWQMLLPEERRNKGEYLSKLHIGASAQLASNSGASPLAHGDGEEKTSSATGTPRLGAGTPKVGVAKSDLMKKLAKNPKQRALDDAKEKKRKEREAAKVDSDREGRPAKKARTATAAAAKTHPKVKSAELVQSSSEDEMSKVRACGTNTARTGTGTNSSQRKAAAAPTKRAPTTNVAAKANPKPIPPPAPAKKSDAAPPKRVVQSKPNLSSHAKGGTSRPTATATASATIKSKPSAVGKNTPTALHPPSSSHQRSQLSPHKPKHRPSAPSPLGPARPRVASDVSDRAAVGVQRAKPGADTPKGLGISNVNGFRKRQDTVTSTTSTESSTHTDKLHGERMAKDKSRPSLSTGSNVGVARKASTASLAHGTKHKGDGEAKRKAMDSTQHEPGSRAAKHRKTESSSSHSQLSVSAGSSNTSDHGRLTPAPGSDVRMSFEQGVKVAQEFREKWYPEYVKLFDELEDIQKRGGVVPSEDKEQLWRMHHRLVQMKREILDASTREHEG